MSKKYVFNVISKCKKCDIVEERYNESLIEPIFEYTCPLLNKKVNPDKIDKDCKLMKYIPREIDGAISS